MNTIDLEIKHKLLELCRELLIESKRLIEESKQASDPKVKAATAGAAIALEIIAGKILEL